MIDKKRQGDAIELTPRMIEAGKHILMLYDEKYSNSEEFIREIFSALMDAREEVG